jgi:hypothetical protein
MKQNKQPFRTEDDIEARSNGIYECNIPVRAFPVGSNTGAQGLMPTCRLRFLYHCGQSTTLELPYERGPLQVT